MTDSAQSIILLRLEFRAKQRIKELPFYQGPLWNALFRDLIRTYASIEIPLAELGFSVQPVETGRVTFRKGEAVHLGISFPEQYVEPILSMLTSFNRIPEAGGRFAPATLALHRITCRVSGNSLSIIDTSIDGNVEVENRARHGAQRVLEKRETVLHPTGKKQLETLSYNTEHLKREASLLKGRERFQVLFHAPLRLKSPPVYKKESGNRFVGQDFFFSPSFQPLTHFFKQMGITDPIPQLKIVDGMMVWQDCPYGAAGTTLGGIMGYIDVEGSLSQIVAEYLVLHQYIGIGKNRTFGFGFYTIPQLYAHWEKGKNLLNEAVLPLTRGVTLFDNACSVNALSDALNRLPDSSPGPDGFTPDDLRKAGSPFPERLHRALYSHEYEPGSILPCRIPKRSGGYRIIHLLDARDKMVHRAIADALLPASEKLLSDSSFAYRRGLNRQGAARAILHAFKKGYRHGFKADIRAFFQTVDIAYLCRLLHALLPLDPLPEMIQTILEDVAQKGVQGLPQGSPLSPVLSNLYLDRFDREMTTQGFRLIRYGDDFVVLYKADFGARSSEDENGNGKLAETICLTAVEASLKELGLALNPGKTVRIDENTPFEFLGYEIVSGKPMPMTDQKRKTGEDPKENWLPIYKEEWVRGYPVYLSSLCRGAYSSGPHLVINNEAPSKNQEIPWNRISRIVIVGRSSFSGGIVYRAVKEDIPVTFIDIMGRETGNLVSSTSRKPSGVDVQTRLVDDPDFCLTFAREIVAAKILNSHVIMRRNKIREPQMKRMGEKALQANSVEQVRGFEGNAARMYFKALKTVVTPFEFEKRVFHPPDNPVNSMLSFGYTLLYNRIATALRNKGLDPRLGFFHRTHGRHCALASDLMEPLRHVIDRIVLALIHLKEVAPDDFTMVNSKDGEYCRLDGEAFRKFIRKYETVMATTFKYTGDESISYNAYIDEMIDMLIRTMKLQVPFTALRIK